MAFGLLSQMDDKRHRKELSLKTSGLNASMIVVGIIVILLGILFIAFTGLMAAVPTESSSSETDNSPVITICGSISCLFGVMGLIMIFVAVITRAKFNRDIEASESEYQKLRLQVIDSLERRARNLK
jgi:uncharacterized membrane protein (DUF485 family)